MRLQTLKATVRPLDDYSNTYIAITSYDPAIGSGEKKKTKKKKP